MNRRKLILLQGFSLGIALIMFLMGRIGIEFLYLGIAWCFYLLEDLGEKENE